MTPEKTPRCWPCQHYRRRAEGPHAWRHECELGVTGFPLLGPACARYCYEPGSDAKEHAHG